MHDEQPSIFLPKKVYIGLIDFNYPAQAFWIGLEGDSVSSLQWHDGSSYDSSVSTLPAQNNGGEKYYAVYEPRYIDASNIRRAYLCQGNLDRIPW